MTDDMGDYSAGLEAAFDADTRATLSAGLEGIAKGYTDGGASSEETQAAIYELLMGFAFSAKNSARVGTMLAKLHGELKAKGNARALISAASLEQSPNGMNRFGIPESSAF
jgi:hydrogenase/urease accessory protein HupE